MTFPLYIFLAIYGLFLVVWIIFSWVALFHMIKFGFKNFTTFFTTFIYIAISLLLLAGSYNFISQIDWQANISLLEGLFEMNNTFY